MSRKRILWNAVSLCIVLAIIAAVASHRAGAKPAPAAPKSTAVVDVTRGLFASSLTAAGQFQSYQEVDLHAKVPGYIRRISVDIRGRRAAWGFSPYDHLPRYSRFPH